MSNGFSLLCSTTTAPVYQQIGMACKGLLMAGTDPRLFGVSPQRLKVSAHKWVMALLSESLAHQPAHSPTRLGTDSG